MTSTLVPYTPLFRSKPCRPRGGPSLGGWLLSPAPRCRLPRTPCAACTSAAPAPNPTTSGMRNDVTSRPTVPYHGEETELLRESAHKFVQRSEEHTSELQSLMRSSYAVFCLKKK